MSDNRRTFQHGDGGGKRKPNEKKSNPFGMPTREEAEGVTSTSGSTVARSMAVGARAGIGVPFGLRSPNFGAPLGMQPELSKMQPASVRKSAPLSAVQLLVKKWVNEESLPTLPPFHPLERTAVFLPDMASNPPVVAGRIIDCLKAMNIKADYDILKAKAKCTTSDGHVEFRIRLYRGRNLYSHGMIVEVQRRYGFSLEYVHVVRNILDVAEGKTVQDPNPVVSALPVSEDDSQMNDTDFGLGFASNMLCKDGATRSANFIGVEWLCSRTDPARIGRNLALRASEKIMLSNDEITRDVRNVVMELIRREGRFSPQVYERFAEDTFLVSLRSRTLTIMANALSNLSDAQQSVSVPDDIISILMEDLKGAPDVPNDAFLAAKSIHALVRMPGNEWIYKISSLLSNLTVARNIGQASHAALAKETDDCIMALASH